MNNDADLFKGHGNRHLTKFLIEVSKIEFTSTRKNSYDIGQNRFVHKSLYW